MNYLDPKKTSLCFHQDNQCIDCIYDGTTYNSVKILRCFPLTAPDDYLSVLYKKEEEYTELGIIQNIKDLDADSANSVAMDLSLRYFLPEIIKIKKVTNRRRFYNFEISTNCGDKEIRVRDIVYSVFTNINGDLILKDVDESYYLIKDYMSSKDKNVKFIRSFL